MLPPSVFPGYSQKRFIKSGLNVGFNVDTEPKQTEEVLVNVKSNRKRIIRICFITTISLAFLAFEFESKTKKYPWLKRNQRPYF